MIFLVRHGEASHHIQDLTGGWTDSCLTVKGEKDIASLARRLKKEFINMKIRIISSDLKRTKHTSHIIAQELSLPVEYASFLREKNNGQAANKTNTLAAALKLDSKNKPLDTKNYPEGESKREFFERVAKGMELLTQTKDDLLIVSHKGTIQNILFWWMNLSIDDVYRLSVSFDVDASSLSILHKNKWQESAIKLLNDCSHLK